MWFIETEWCVASTACGHSWSCCIVFPPNQSKQCGGNRHFPKSCRPSGEETQPSQTQFTCVFIFLWHIVIKEFLQSWPRLQIGTKYKNINWKLCFFVLLSRKTSVVLVRVTWAPFTGGKFFLKSIFSSKKTKAFSIIDHSGGGGCNMQHSNCVQSPLLSGGDQARAGPITQSSTNKLQKVNQWWTRDSDGCGQFKPRKQHIAPLTPRWGNAVELYKTKKI